MTGHDRHPACPAEHPPPSPTITRRTAIGLGAAFVAGAALGPEPAGAWSGPAGQSGPVGAPHGSVRPGGIGPTRTANPATIDTQAADLLRPEIAPRDSWGADLAVLGEILPEDDVRFLLVHHTASSNDYGPDGVAGQIRSFYDFHTGPEKGWPDVAYNFFIDRFGGIWEARAGSLEGPVRGDATGGSQGFALLCSLIGDYGQVAVPEAARHSLVQVLAWLAERHRIDTEPGATVEFVSRGSNRWPAGTTVTAATISGHRDMSQTTCPGDFAYDLLAVDLPRAVSDLRAQTEPSTTTTAAMTSSTTPTTAAADATTASAAEPPTSGQDGAAPASIGSEVAAGDSDGESGVDPLDAAIGGIAALGAVGLAAGAIRGRSRGRDRT